MRHRIKRKLDIEDRNSSPGKKTEGRIIGAIELLGGCCTNFCNLKKEIVNLNLV